MFVLTLNSMWYFVEKNGKVVKARKTLGGAVTFAENQLDFNPRADVVRIVDNYGEIHKEF